MRHGSWELHDNGLDFVVKLTEHMMKIGYGVGLTGSVLTKGRSKKDIDVILYPYDTSKHQLPIEIAAHLELFGLSRLYDQSTVKARWKKLGSRDGKHVEVWTNQRAQQEGDVPRRIDFFFLR